MGAFGFQSVRRAAGPRLLAASYCRTFELRNVPSSQVLRAYYSRMDKKDLAAYLTGAESLDRHVRREHKASGGDVTGTIYDVDPALQGVARGAAVMAKAQEAMDRNAGSAKSAEVTRASAQAATDGVQLARGVEDIFDSKQPPKI